MIVAHDLHIHTNLSACSKDPQATAANYIARAAELGLSTIGFADHLWDSNMPGASQWYQPQNLLHTAQIRERLPDNTGGVRVLIGCESEYCGDGKVGISPAVAEQLDFVLLPMSHFHMKGFVLPSGISSTRDIADLLVQRFNEVVGLGIATGIAHPFLPCGFTERADEIIAAISDEQFADCFGRAAEAGVSIEVHPAFFPEAVGKQKEGLHDETFLRVLSIAKKCGCYFHFASDTHSLAGLSQVLALEKCAEQLAIGTEDILPILR